MHFIIHTQYYPPEIGAPQARLSELAQNFSKRGIKVTILTALPNYPTGKVFAGYGMLPRIEKAGNMTILRCTIIPSQSASFIPRMLSYFSFVFSSLLVGIGLIRNADYLLTESPPLFLGLTGYLLSRLKRAKWIFNVSDLWPESAVRLGVITRSGYSYKISAALEAFFYRKAWVVSGQSHSILEDIQNRFPDVRTYHLSNGADTTFFSPEKAEKIQNDQAKVVAVYAGLHGIAQGLDKILLAAKKLMDLCPQLHFVFIGDGPVKRQLIDQASQLGLKNITFQEPVPKDQMPAVIASADICIVPLGLFLPGAVPSKLYEAMASGRPVIMVAEGEPAEIVNLNKAGLVVAPNDILGLERNLQKLVQNKPLRDELGKNGRNAVVNHYNRASIVNNFANFLIENL